MGAKSPSKTQRISSNYHCCLTPLSKSIFSFALLAFQLFLSHGSDIEAVAWSATLPLSRLAEETGQSRQWCRGRGTILRQVAEQQGGCMGWWPQEPWPLSRPAKALATNRDRTVASLTALCRSVEWTQTHFKGCQKMNMSSLGIFKCLFKLEMFNSNPSFPIHVMSLLIKLHC